jgi:hypothetical protein
MGQKWTKRLQLGGMLVLAAFVAAGCDSDPTEPGDPPPEFSGQFVAAEAFEDVFGSAIISVFESAFSVAVALQETPDPGEDGHPWTLSEGSCENPGDLLLGWDDLPGITLDDDGNWSETGITADLDEVEGFALEVRHSTDEPDTVIACATLEEDS